VIQLDFTGWTGEVTATELAGLQTSFTRCGGAHLPALLAPTVLAQIERRCRPDAFAPRDLGTLGTQLRGVDATAETALRLTLNRRPLLQLLEQVAGCGPLVTISGHIARLEPDTGQELIWHDDTHVPQPAVGFSVNLGRVPFRGGEFQLRAKGSQELRWMIANTGPGVGVCFSIAPAWEHRVTPVTGAAARTVFTGWAVPSRTPSAGG
jgi:hypothetical protein